MPKFRAKIQLYREATTGDFRWRYVARNGRIMADSGEGYKNKKDAIDGADQVTGHRLILGLLKLEDLT